MLLHHRQQVVDQLVGDADDPGIALIVRRHGNQVDEARPDVGVGCSMHPDSSEPAPALFGCAMVAGPGVDALVYVPLPLATRP